MPVRASDVCTLSAAISGTLLNKGGSRFNSLSWLVPPPGGPLRRSPWQIHLLLVPSTRDDTGHVWAARSIFT